VSLKVKIFSRQIGSDSNHWWKDNYSRYWQSFVDAIAISETINHWLTDWQGWLLGDAIASKNNKIIQSCESEIAVLSCDDKFPKDVLLTIRHLLSIRLSSKKFHRFFFLQKVGPRWHLTTNSMFASKANLAFDQSLWLLCIFSHNSKCGEYLFCFLKYFANAISRLILYL